MSEFDKLKQEQSDLLRDCQNYHLHTIMAINEYRDCQTVDSQVETITDIAKRQLEREVRHILENLDALVQLKDVDPKVLLVQVKKQLDLANQKIEFTRKVLVAKSASDKIKQEPAEINSEKKENDKPNGPREEIKVNPEN